MKKNKSISKLKILAFIGVGICIFIIIEGITFQREYKRQDEMWREVMEWSFSSMESHLPSYDEKGNLIKEEIVDDVYLDINGKPRNGLLRIYHSNGKSDGKITY
ncbi:hypothetical protein KAR91_45115 [Candidatus Pacearchaeota archaeon]|nr:hypothetical protein [Candidatus Pacearchaeota archaeon]